MKILVQKYYLLVLIICILAVKCVYAEKDEARALKHFFNGMYASEILENPRVALSEFILSESYAEDEPTIKFQIALCYADLDNYAQAYLYAKSAYEHGMNDNDVLWLLIFSSANLNRCNEARNYILQGGLETIDALDALEFCDTSKTELKLNEQFLEKLHKKYGDEMLILYMRGKIALLQNKYKDAKEFFMKKIDLYPDTEMGYIEVIKVYDELNIPDSAFLLLKRYSQIFEYDNAVASFYADRLYMNKMFKEATDFIVKRRMSSFGNSYYWTNYCIGYSQLLFTSQKYDHALYTFEKFSEIDSNDFVILYLAGKCYDFTFCPESAIVMYDKALQISHEGDIYGAKFLSLAELNDTINLRLSISESETLSKDLKESSFWAGVALSRIGLYNEAINKFKSAIDTSYSNIDHWFYYITALELAGRRLEAITELDTAIAKGLYEARFNNLLGYVLADENIRLNDAKALILDALFEDPNNEAYIDSYGWLKFREGDYDSALYFVNTALKGMSNDSEVLYHLGEIYIALNNIELGRKYIWNSLQIDPYNDKVYKRLMQIDWSRKHGN